LIESVEESDETIEIWENLKKIIKTSSNCCHVLWALLTVLRANPRPTCGRQAQQQPLRLLGGFVIFDIVF